MVMPEYNEAAVQREIEKARRRQRVSKREERAIHALLKGWRGSTA